MLVLAAVSSRNTRRSGSSTGWLSNQATRAALMSSRSRSTACSAPLLRVIRRRDEEAKHTAGADRDPVRLRSFAQLAQEDLRASLIRLLDEVGMSLDVARTLARLTPKRSAACRQVAPAQTADATRWGRSADKVVGMGSICSINPEPFSTASPRTSPALAARTQSSC